MKYLKLAVVTMAISFGNAFAGPIGCDDIDRVSGIIDQSILGKVRETCAEVPSKVSEALEAPENVADSVSESVSEVVTKAKEKVIEVANPESVHNWGDSLGNIGQKLAETAMSLGIATNEFIKSPAGILIILGVLGAYFGWTIVAVAIAVGVIWVLIRGAKFIRQRGTEEVEKRFTLFGFNISSKTKTIPVYEEYGRMEEFQVFFMIVLYLAATLIGLITIINLIN